MGTINIGDLKFADEDETRIISALKEYWVTHDSNGVEVKPKTADIKTMLRGMLAAQVSGIVYRIEVEKATFAATAGITPPVIT